MKVLLNNDHDIRAAHERYQHFTKDDEARQAYEDRMKFLRDQANREETARDEGREEGREQGREEQARQIAAKLKASGMDTQQIADLTGLTVEEVAGL